MNNNENGNMFVNFNQDSNNSTNLNGTYNNNQFMGANSVNQINNGYVNTEMINNINNQGNTSVNGFNNPLNVGNVANSGINMNDNFNNNGNVTSTTTNVNNINNYNQNSFLNNSNYSYSSANTGNSSMETNNSVVYPVSYVPPKKKKSITYAKFLLILSFVLLVAVFVVFGNDLFFSGKGVITNEPSELGRTAVVSTNIYKDVQLNNRTDAINLIVSDSDLQKEKCTNEEIKKIERRIENKHKIIAVNLCEMDVDFALELEKTIDKVFSEFPTIKGYLTNVTLTNPDENTSYIAAFTATQLFATASSVDTYPHVYKMVMNLNTDYFLDPDYLTDVVNESSESGYFPKGATRSSAVAHEFGHYLSFVSLLRSTFLDDTLLLTNYNYQRYLSLVESWNRGDFSKKLINEAYNNYKKASSKNTLSEYEFRASISEYAVATDGAGNDIYDETIAEGFHDYYINGNKAKTASKYIIQVLKKYMNGSIS